MTKLIQSCFAGALLLMFSGCSSLYISSSFELVDQKPTENQINLARAVVLKLAQEYGATCPIAPVSLDDQFKCEFPLGDRLLELTAFQPKRREALLIVIRSNAASWFPVWKKHVSRFVPKRQLEIETAIIKELGPDSILKARRSYAGFDRQEDISTGG